MLRKVVTLVSYRRSSVLFLMEMVDFSYCRLATKPPLLTMKIVAAEMLNVAPFVVTLMLKDNAGSMRFVMYGPVFI